MPLVRFEVRNEFGLGDPEMYRAANKDDSKAFLDGLAVAGLVGILRQLGDLAEFAAEVFHDLQEQVMVTAARSHKMMIRVQHIETALPPLEENVFSLENHIHFSHTTSSVWHANIRTEQNHLIHSDLPQFIMSSYEECRDPPRLHLLDKFDTGGSGSCLKRYSDPSFFKRALDSSDPTNAENFQREMKSQKGKKKVSRLRNVEISHAVSISRDNGRMQFASPNIYGPNAAAETISNFGMRPKSELGDQSTSHDSGNRLGYIESISHVSSSMRHEEKEYNELLTSRLTMYSSDTMGSNSNEESGGADDVFPHMHLKERSVNNSSSLIWDEKAEDILHHDENIPESLSDGNQFDEVGSEPDNYVDALNTMVSESETDFEHQTKQDKELPSDNFKDNGMECGTAAVDSTIAQASDSSNVEPCNEPFRSLNKEISNSFSNSVPPQVIGMSSNLDISLDTDLCGSTDLLNGFDFSEPSSGFNIPTLQVPLNDKATNILYESEESHADISVGSSTKFWTNGGMLGLEPSRPQDCSALNLTSQNSTHGTEVDDLGLSSDTVMPKFDTDGSITKLDIFIKTPEPIEKHSCSRVRDVSPDLDGLTDLSLDQFVRRMGNMVRTIDHSECSTSCHDKHLNYMSKDNALEILSTISKAKLEKPKDSCHSSGGFSNTLGHGSLEIGVMTPGAVSGMADVKEQLKHGSPTNSLSSSPPLAHMKFSFHPIDGFEALKLNSIKDVIFPSFQFLPDHDILIQDIGLESDDDTFCRSSQYMSDDPMSQHSESNSEQWEYNDALRRVSSAESISSALQLEGIFRDNIYSDCDFKCPDVDSGSLQNVPNFNASGKDLDLASQYSNETSPPLPPLPPMQWRVMKPQFSVAEDKQGSISDDVSLQYNLRVPGSTTSKKRIPAPPKQPQNKEATACTQKSNVIMYHQMLIGHREVKKAVNGKDTDEKEDLLHQIRSKSLSLRRTVTARPTVPPTDTKMTAILEKANAIRQAFVGSDEEDDDNWSDS